MIRVRQFHDEEAWRFNPAGRKMREENELGT